MRSHLRQRLLLTSLSAALVTVAACEDNTTIVESCETTCGDVCADLDHDPNHCGACDNACAEGESCVAGSCAPTCPAATEVCNDTCVDTQSNPAHCGTCDNACGADEVCDAGVCAGGCSGDTTDCSGACVDTDHNPLHCGGCDAPCVGDEICQEGICTACALPLETCDDSCVDTQTDAAHCGGCNVACGAGELCEAGQCTAQTPLALMVTTAYDDLIARDATVVYSEAPHRQVNVVEQNFHTVLDAATTPSGDVVILGNLETDGVSELFLALPNASPVKLSGALTAGDSITRFQLSADGSRVIYVVNGNSLYTAALDTPGVAVQVHADTVSGNILDSAISEDGSRIVYRAADDTPGVNELYVAELGSLGTVNRVHQAHGTSVQSWTMSADGSTVAYDIDLGSLDEVYVADLATPGTATLASGTPGATAGQVRHLALSHDGAVLIYASDQFSQSRRGIVMVNTSSPGVEVQVGPTSGLARDFNRVTINAPGTHASFRSNRVTQSVMAGYIVDLSTPEIVTLLGDDTTRIDTIAFSPDGQHVAANEQAFGAIIIAPTSAPENAVEISGGVTDTAVGSFTWTRDSEHVVAYVDGAEGAAGGDSHMADINIVEGSATLIDSPLTPRLLFSDAAPSVSADGSTVVWSVVPFTNPVERLYVANTADPSNGRPLHAWQGQIEPDTVDLAADGSLAAFIGNVASLGTNEVFVADTAASTSTRLNPAYTMNTHATQVQLSADGTQAVYLANQDNLAVFELYLVDVAAPGVTTKLNAALPADVSVADFAFSADGTTVAYVVEAPTAGVRELYFVDTAAPGVATHASATVTTHVGDVLLTSDGSQAVFSDQTNASVFVVDKATPGTQTELNAGSPISSPMKLSHDETTVFFLSGTQLFLAPLNTPGAQQVSDGSHVVTSFAITPDDSRVVYASTNPYLVSLSQLTMATQLGTDDVLPGSATIAVNDTHVVFLTDSADLRSVAFATPTVETDLTEPFVGQGWEINPALHLTAAGDCIAETRVGGFATSMGKVNVTSPDAPLLIGERSQHQASVLSGF